MQVFAFCKKAHPAIKSPINFTDFTEIAFVCTTENVSAEMLIICCWKLNLAFKLSTFN